MKKHLLYISILVTFICLVLAQQHILPIWACLVFILGLGTYFWPVQFVLDAIRQTGAKAILTSFWSNYLYSHALVWPAIVLLSDHPMMRTIAIIAAVLNALTGFAYHFFNIDEEKARRHFIMGLFGCTYFGGVC
ncbi:MAG: hypothetical protein LBF90_01105 [Prevotellaceae bacterium]|jgi:FtsH-binding integral membrane protein|nr:hypothetical protein [Prevotellaceae bacterium]